MNRLIEYIKQFHIRSKRHFTELKDEIALDNLSTLRIATIGFELFLTCYGIWSFFAFNNDALTKFYLFYLLPNTILMYIAIKGKISGQISFRRVQIFSTLYIIEVMTFIIGISVFPFPDRPAIFYSLAYTMMILIFQFSVLQMASILTVITGVFIVLVITFKEPVTISYDLVSSITTWLLNVFVLYAVSNLRIRNGEIQLELRHQSHTDYLSGLINRREMDNLFNRIYRRCKAIQKDITVIMLDIDHFKQFNDKFGHAAGDDFIKHIGTTLTDFIEETGFFAARYGGEEFALLLPGCDKTEARHHAERLLQELRFPDPDGNIMTVSIGIATETAETNGTLQALIKNADKALYRAKSQGRDCFFFAE